MHVFYTLVITQTFSLIGSRMTSTAIGLRVFAETGNAAPLLLVAFFNELPAMLGNSFAGVLVDRWDRKRVLVLSDTGQAVGSLLLMLSFASGSFQLWHLYIIALMNGIFSMFQGPAKDAAITTLVPVQQRERANALQGMTFTLAGVVAPPLAGLLYELVRLPGIVLIDLLTFTAAVLVVSRLHIPRPAQTEEGRASSGGFWREFAGGFRYLQTRRALFGLVLYFTVLNFLLNGSLELAIPYIMTITGSETITGIVLAMNSLGGLVGGAVLAFWGGTRPRIHTVMPAMLIVGAMFVVHGSTRAPLLLAVSIFLLIGTLQSWAIFTSILQVKTPPDMQGRVFAMVGQLGYLASTCSFLLIGPLVDEVLEPRAAVKGDGIGLLLVVTGIIILVMTTLVYALPGIRHLERDLPDYAATN